MGPLTYFLVIRPLNELQCSNHADTREQLRVAIERRVDRACTQRGMGLAANGEHHEGGA